MVEFFRERPECKFLIGNLMMFDGKDKIISKPSTRLQTILKYWPCRFP